MGSNPTEEDAMDLDSSNGSEGKGDGDDQVQSAETTPKIRYIDLTEHPALNIEALSFERFLHHDCATYIVRDEYRIFMDHVLSCLRVQDSVVRFLLTGQSGIGKSFGTMYILMYLLASGQSVFFITSSDSAYFFSSNGVQYTTAKLRPHSDVEDAVSTSWVLIDLAVGDRYWTPPSVLRVARCIIWSSSPQETTIKTFTKYFNAELWFMAAWTNQEIAAVTERYRIPQKDIQEKLNIGGPVARHLFGRQPSVTLETLGRLIDNVLANNPFGFALSDNNGHVNQPSHRVYLIQPFLIIDTVSGQICFQRADYRVEFLSAYIADEMCARSQKHLDKVQGQLSVALDTDTTRSVAGKLLERIMHRALADHAVHLPSVLGDAYIAGTLRLIGKAANFSSEPKQGSNDRPLYLQPKNLNFAAVDAIIVTEKKLGLIQTSLSRSHARHFGTMLRIIARLPKGANVAVDAFDSVLYCLVGSDPKRVKKLVVEAQRKLEELKLLDSRELCEMVGLEHTYVAHRRLSTFSVVGYTFHHQLGFSSI